MSPRAATFAVFAVNGAMIGTWVAHIPWLQERLEVSKTTIGFALLCMAAGALIAMPLTGQILDRRSSAGVTRVATLVYCLMLPLPLIAPSAVALGAILFVFGAANGAMDVSMNAHGVAVERDLGRPIMSSLHGGWSVGGFLAAGLSAVAGAAGADPRLVALTIGVALWLVAWWVTARLGEASTHSHGERLRAALARRDPDRRAVLSGDDGRGGDRRLERHLPAPGPRLQRRRRGDGRSPASRSGWRSPASAATGSTQRLGAGPLLRGGMALVALALGAVLLIGEPVPAVVGFALVGLGIANAVPILFSAAGRHEPAGPSLAAVFTVGYTGFIVGPPAIGALGDTIGLPETLGLLCVIALAVTALGRAGYGRSLAGAVDLTDQPGGMRQA